MSIYKYRESFYQKMTDFKLSKYEREIKSDRKVSLYKEIIILRNSKKKDGEKYINFWEKLQEKRIHNKEFKNNNFYLFMRLLNEVKK